MKLIAVLLFCIGVAKGYPSASSRISNGFNADIKDYPFLVSITFKDDHICGGFIYNERFVVTTTTCLYDLQNSDLLDLNVIAGQINLILPEDSEQRKQVRAIYKHENYDPLTFVNDIALIELTNSFVLGQPYVEVGIYDEVDRDANLTARFAGWGAVEQGGLPSTALQQTTLLIDIDGAQCLIYGDLQFQTNTMVCAAPIPVPETGEPGPIDGGHPCHYDEGSPLIQEVRDASGRPFNGIVGIMSKTLGCDLANQKNPTVFTRLSAYYAWLFRIAGAQPAPAK